METKQRIEKKFEELKTQHGGLNGVEDTGYDDNAMDAYMRQESASLMIDSNDFDKEEYETLLMEHRNHLLQIKMKEDET